MKFKHLFTLHVNALWLAIYCELRLQKLFGRAKRGACLNVMPGGVRVPRTLIIIGVGQFGVVFFFCVCSNVHYTQFVLTVVCKQNRLKV